MREWRRWWIRQDVLIVNNLDDFQRSVLDRSELSKPVEVIEIGAVLNFAERVSDLIAQLKDQNCILPGEIDSVEGMIKFLKGEK